MRKIQPLVFVVIPAGGRDFEACVFRLCVHAVRAYCTWLEDGGEARRDRLVRFFSAASPLQLCAELLCYGRIHTLDRVLRFVGA